MKIPYALSLVVASILTTGCAGAPKSPQQSDLSHVEAITEDCQLDLSRAMAITGDNDTVVMVEGSSGKGGGAVAGGAVSGGTALAIGTLSCVATGPIFFVPCLGFVLPGTTVAAAVGGTAYGAINSESADGVEEKRNMLTEALRDPIASQRLVNLVEKKRLEAVAIVPPSMEKTLTTTVPEWTLRIAMTELATVGSGPDTPYLLQASANLEVMHAGDVKPLFIKEFQSVSPVKMSTAEWRANNDEPVRTALDNLLKKLAIDMLNDLMHVEMSGVPLLANTNIAKNELEFKMGDVVLVESKFGDTQKITITHIDDRFVVGTYEYTFGHTTGVNYDRRDIKSIEYFK